MSEIVIETFVAVITIAAMTTTTLMTTIIESPRIATLETESLGNYEMCEIPTIVTTERETIGIFVAEMYAI